jgi:tryptophan synthase alpha chain
MSRIADRFAALRERGRKALVVYLVAGDPEADQTLRIMQAVVAAGADVIELGIPFSDPEAEGPVIQAGCERALRSGMRLGGALDLVARFRLEDGRTPVVLMGYLNPVEAMGYARFAERAAASGVDGVLLVNLPPEESGELETELRGRAIDPIYLLAPTTTVERAGRILAHAAGFVYYVSLKGVTGAANLDVDDVARRVSHLRASIALPLVVGFGIRDARAAAAVAVLADGVVVGSALVELIGRLGREPAHLTAAVTDLVGDIRRGIDDAVAAARPSGA